MNGITSCMILLLLLGSSVVSGASGPAAELGWNYEVLDNGINPTAPSIRIDSQGYPHIAYIRVPSGSQSRELIYAWFDGYCWRSESLLLDPQLEYCFLALNSGDEPCIVYQSDSHPYTVRYATQDSGGGWVIVDIASSRNTGHLYGIEVGPDDDPHVIYYDVDWSMGEKDSHHLYFQGTGWVDEYVWYFGDASGCWGISMVLEPQGDPQFFQYNYFAGFDGRQYDWTRPVHTQRSGSSWSASYLGDYQGDETDIALSEAGLPRVVFQDGNLLHYALYDGIIWNFTQVDPAHAAQDHCALIPDGSDTPPVAYQDSGNDDLRYAWCDGGWNTMLIDSAGEVGVNLDAAVDADGNPFIVHYDATGQQLRLAWYGDPTGVEGSPAEMPSCVSISAVFPNPATDRMTATVRMAGEGPASLSIYDLGGRLVRRTPASVYPEGISEHELDLTSLDRGVYFLRIGTPLEGDAVLFTVLRGGT